MALATACAGCLPGSSRGYPLYPPSYPPTDPARLCRLSGYVRFVDSQDVSAHGKSFEVLPGCHVIGTPDSWGGNDASGGVVASTGRVTFALPMKSGHDYAIVVDVGPLSGPSGSVSVRAEEHARTGERTRTFAPVSNEEEIRRCMASDDDAP